ncbi:MAG: hypothetical protein ACREQ3_22405 [Candidatus Binatia bacterium]
MSDLLGVAVGGALIVSGVLGVLFRRKFGASIVSVNNGIFPSILRKASKSVAGGRNEGEVLAAILSVGWIVIGFGIVAIIAN